MEKFNRLDNSTKGMIIGIGAATLVGIAGFAFFLSSEDAGKASKAVYNRTRAKHVVNKKFSGNRKAKKMINKMSDSEINNLLAAADKANDLENQLGDAVGEVGNFFNKQGKKVKKLF